MKSLYKIVALVGLSIMVTSCHNKSKPNYQFFPNMYESVGYETYSESDAFANGKEGQLVPEGAIKRGFVPQIVIIDYLNICSSSRLKMSGGINSYLFIILFLIFNFDTFLGIKLHEHQQI